MELSTPLSHLAGIGPSLASRLKRLNLVSVEDLLYHFPFRYDDFSKSTSVLEAQVGEMVTLQGEIWSIKNIYTRFGKILTQAIFNDSSGPIQLTWFNQSWLTKQISVGDRLQVSGKISKYKNKLSIMAPKWEQCSTLDVEHKNLHTGRLVPVYPETFNLSSKWLRTKIAQFLPQIKNQIEDYLPAKIRENMLPLDQALDKIHFPADYEEVEKAKKRLSFDELFLIQLATQQTRIRWKQKKIVQPWKIDKKGLENFIDSLSFKLTLAQEKVLEEIIVDLSKSVPMNRLLQGEVGSGKTVVAAATIYIAYQNGFKTYLMAPTEILAWQHFETISKLLSPFAIKVGIYTGSRKKVEESDVIIGTHALLSDKLQAQNIGLVIIDEQHRFGVDQRTALRQKSQSPHFLTMTATPIPRTVALTLYGDLDLSIIDELPKERLPVKTYIVPEIKRADSYKFISKKVREGDQVYIITPLIEQSETLADVKAAKVEFEKLQKIFPNLKLGLLHGRLKSKEKAQIINEFKAGKLNILISTSVVEVGMDIPNATIMVVEGAERFGLAQLHQLRGRIGRGVKQSFCLLFTSNSSKEEQSRLKHLERTFDGLKLAELDLKIRGSGTIFSTLQHGRFDLKIADFSDLSLIEKVKNTAENLLQDNQSLDKYPKLKRKLQNLAKVVMPD